MYYLQTPFSAMGSLSRCLRRSVHATCTHIYATEGQKGEAQCNPFPCDPKPIMPEF